MKLFNADENALVIIYGGSNSDSLDKLRYKWFIEKVTKSTSHIESHSLPPTAAAAKYHSLSVFYQIIDWKGI